MIKTYWRAAQRDFLPTCQEMVEVSLNTSETGYFLRSREQLPAMYQAMLDR